MLRCGWLATVVGVLALSPAAEQGKNPVVVIETSMGNIKVELFEDKAPITVKNFLEYVDAKHYDGTIFHRVIKDFMIQGGGMDVNNKQKPTKAPIKNEAGNGLANARGTIAMARTNNPDSATSQFFINTVDNKFLDRANAQDKVGYCVFGKVLEGMDVVDKIRAVQVGANDVPQNVIVIKSVRKVEKK
ncbi:MAG TPA: peptidylprolyl isomerase [Gemmataceae bacterium]|nr:peptidylprolyl isomerase [Gemmataceae bacterium]